MLSFSYLYHPIKREKKSQDIYYSFLRFELDVLIRGVRVEPMADLDSALPWYHGIGVMKKICCRNVNASYGWF